MIGYEQAKKQVQRLEHLREFPSGAPAAIKELVVAVQCAPDEARAQNVLDEFIHWGNDFCPTPAAIRQAMFSGIEPAPLPPPKPTCSKCGGSGVIRRRFEAYPGLGEGEYEFTCTCVIGSAA